jgi:hypothetical protein
MPSLLVLPLDEPVPAEALQPVSAIAAIAEPATNVATFPKRENFMLFFLS